MWKSYCVPAWHIFRGESVDMCMCGDDECVWAVTVHALMRIGSAEGEEQGACNMIGRGLPCFSKTCCGGPCSLLEAMLMASWCV